MQWESSKYWFSLFSFPKILDENNGKQYFDDPDVADFKAEAKDPNTDSEQLI